MFPAKALLPTGARRCPAGMEHFACFFREKNMKTVANHGNTVKKKR